MRGFVQAYQRIGLVPLIVIGLVLGVIIGSLANPTMLGILPMSAAKFISMFGTLFVGALKAIAPLLVFVLEIGRAHV